MNWIKCSDRLPEDSMWCKIKIANKIRPYYVKFWDNGEGKKHFVNILFEKERNVTHWMPELPKDL